MNMTKEQMKEMLTDIELIEQDFGRELTDEEFDIVMAKGYKALLEHLEIDDIDYKTMRRCLKLITSGFTESADAYDTELEKDNYRALEAFRSLVSDLEVIEEQKKAKKLEFKDQVCKKTVIKLPLDGKIDCGYKEENDPELDDIFNELAQKEADQSETGYNPEKDLEIFGKNNFLDRLISGEAVKLTSEQIDKVYDYLEDKNNYAISIINGLTTLKI